MSKHALEPPRDLLDKVIFIAEFKAQLPLDVRGLLNDWGVFCRVNRLPSGALFYQAGGKLIARLRFTVEKDGSITIHKYKPGDWERNLAPTYAYARFWADTQNAQRGKEIDELLAGAQDTEEIQRLEQRANVGPTQADYSSTISRLVGLYLEAGRYRDAEKAAVNAVEAWPSQPLPHFALHYIYYMAVLNAKRVKVGEANERFIREYGIRAAGLIPAALGYTYEQAYALAEKHIAKALDCTSPNDKGSRRKLQKMLSELKAVGAAPDLKEFEDAVNRNPDSATAWSMLSWYHMETGKFKAAEEAASTAVRLAPDVAQLHFALSTIYYGALANSKGTMSSDEFTRLLGTGLLEHLRRKEPQIFASYEKPPAELTLEVLQCNGEYARQMVETYAMETIKLSKDKRLRKAAEDQLATLKLMDQM